MMDTALEHLCDTYVDSIHALMQACKEGADEKQIRRVWRAACIRAGYPEMIPPDDAALPFGFADGLLIGRSLVKDKVHAS